MVDVFFKTVIPINNATNPYYTDNIFGNSVLWYLILFYSEVCFTTRCGWSNLFQSSMTMKPYYHITIHIMVINSP